MAKFIDAIGKMQWGVVAAFIDEKEYRTLNGIPLDAVETQNSLAVRCSQLQQKSSIKQRHRYYNIAQTDTLQKDLIKLSYEYTEIGGTFNGGKISCFIIYNDYRVLTNAEWQARIERLARKYKQPAYIVGYKGKTGEKRFLPSRIEEKDECSRVFYYHSLGCDESIVQGIDDINSLLNSYIRLFKENGMVVTFNADYSIEFSFKDTVRPVRGIYGHLGGSSGSSPFMKAFKDGKSLDEFYPDIKDK